MFSKRAQVLALAASAAGCGALEPGGELDHPTFTIAGHITPASDAVTETYPLSMGLLWIDPAGVGKGNTTSGDELVAAAFQGNDYTMNLRGAAPAAAIRALAIPGTTATLAYAFAEIVLYEDHRRDDGQDKESGDHRFEVGSLVDGSPIVAPDVYRGMSPLAVLLYVEQPMGPEVRAQLPELMDVVGTRGWHLGQANCGADTITEVEPDKGPPVANMILTAPSTAFPDLRACLRSQPTPPPPAPPGP